MTITAVYISPEQRNQATQAASKPKEKPAETEAKRSESVFADGWNTEAKPVQPSKQAQAPAKPVLTPKEQLAKSLAQDQLGEYLDVDIKDGMLIITANEKKPAWYNIFTDLSIERRMSTIKQSLGLKDGTIAKYNEDVKNRFSDSFVRGYGSTPDDGVLAEGSSMRIPVSVLGEDPNIFQWIGGTFDDLKE